MKLWSLLRLGRQAKIFVITATQRPDVNFIPGEARSNLVARVAMGKQDGPALDMVFNTRMVQQRIHETITDPDTGEKLIKRIRGRAIVDIGGGPVSVQTFGPRTRRWSSPANSTRTASIWSLAIRLRV